jgi:hypothetical protein
MSQQTRGLLLLAAGLAGVGAGLWEASRLAHDIIYEAQGKCDYVSCTNSWTMPSVAGVLLLLTAGAALLTWSLLFDRRRSRDGAEKRPGSNLT